MNSKDSLLPWPGPRAESLAIVGHTTERSARLWCCLPPGAATDACELVVFGDRESLPDPRDDRGVVFSARLLFGDEDVATALVPVDGLEPGTAYRVGVRADGGAWLLGADEPWRFRTDPADDGRLRFALVSCHDPYRGRTTPGHLETWTHLATLLRDTTADGPATFVIAGGDQVYADADTHLSIPALVRDRALADDADALRAEYRELYHRHWAFDSVRAVHRNVPTYMMWDDHDVFDGFGSQRAVDLNEMLGSADRAPAVYAAARHVFLDYQASHNPAIDDGRTDDAVDFVLRKGDATFFVLDGRSCRRRADGGVILGDAQIERFRRWVQTFEAETPSAAFVVSAVPVVHLAAFAVNAAGLAQYAGLEDDIYDEWEHPEHCTERDLWLRPLFEASHRLHLPVAILSGDVHVGAAFRLDADEFPAATVYQITSSAISQPGLPTSILAAGVAPRGQLAVAEDNAFHVRFGLLTPVIEGNNFAVLSVGDGSAVGGVDDDTGVCTFYERLPSGEVVEHSRIVLWGVQSEWTAEIEKRTRRVSDNEQREAATALLVAQLSATESRWNRIRDARGVVDVGAVDLSGLDFAGFDLSGIDLRAAKVGRGGLNGADLESAVLPEHLGDYSGVLAVVTEQSIHIRTVLLMLMAACFISAVAIMQLSPSAFISASQTAALPVIGISISAHMLMPIAALSVGLLLVHVVNETLTMVATLRRLPLRFPSGSWLHEVVHPWMTTRILARALERRLVPTQKIGTAATAALGGVMAFLLGGFALAVLTRSVEVYYANHIERLLSVVSLGAGAGLSAGSIAAFLSVVRNPGGHPEALAAIRTGSARSGRFGYAGRRAGTKVGWITAMTAIFVALIAAGGSALNFHSGRPFPLQLDHQSLAGLTLPPGTTVAELSARRSTLDSLSCGDCVFTDGQFDGASMRTAYLRGATLDGVGLRSVDLSGSDLIEASISNSSFDGATLTGAAFRRATLSETAFEGAALAGGHFDQATVRDVTFAGSDLSNTSFVEATLTDVTFRAATLANADFSGAQLLRVQFIGTQMHDIVFEGASLTDVNFANASLVDGSFRNADLDQIHFQATDATGLDATCLPGARVCQTGSLDLRFSSLVRSRWTGRRNGDSLRLDGSDGTGIHLDDTSFATLDARRTTFTAAHMVGLTAASARIDGADLTRGDLTDAALGPPVSLSGAVMTGAVLRGANLCGATGSRLALSGAEALCVDLSHASLPAVDMTDANLQGARLIGLKFERATVRRTLFGSADFGGPISATESTVDGVQAPDGADVSTVELLSAHRLEAAARAAACADRVNAWCDADDE